MLHIQSTKHRRYQSRRLNRTNELQVFCGGVGQVVEFWGREGQFWYAALEQGGAQDYLEVKALGHVEYAEGLLLGAAGVGLPF